MILNTIFELPEHQIKLEQQTRGGNLFTLTYGLQVERNLTYRRAAAELGECIFHALACEGKLNNNVD